MNTDYDVVIAGGGMVGISFALALDHFSAGALRTLVVESFAVPDTAATSTVDSATTHRPPSFDARATALSHGSRLILENIGVWPQLALHANAIYNIHVSERGHFGSATLETERRGWPALGHVVENARLGRVLLEKLRQRPSITWLSPARVVDCAPGPDHATITIDDGSPRTVTTRLLSIADGANSGLRTRLGIGSTTHDYQRQAIIATIGCSRPHAGWAFERFTDWGPMALLPLANSAEGQPRMALVWTMTDERAAPLLDCSDQEFLDALQQRFGPRQGRFTRVGGRTSYDLRLTTADEQIRRQLVLIGNAAHSLHPVAGQGFNLALRDVVRLAQILATAAKAGAAPGELTVLQRYLAEQSQDQRKTIFFSDRVTALFEQPNRVAGALRRLGLAALDQNTSAKNYFIDHSAGHQAGAALGI